MKPYCEIVAIKLLPAIRALVAKELIEKYKMTQQQAAKKLGMTQSAISQYIRELRGSKLEAIENDKIIYEKIEAFVNGIASNEIDTQPKLLESFCVICKTVRKRKLLCNLHVSSFPELAGCDLCVR